MEIRKVSESDVERITDIEYRSFSAPFTREMYFAMVKASPPFYGMIASENGAVNGYLFYSIAADEMELLTIAVDEPSRKKGIARALLKEMLSVASASGVKTVFLEVRPSNAPAISLYRNFGFVDFGIRKGYYKDNNEDAVTMKKEL